MSAPLALILGTLETAATQREEITLTDDDLTVTLTHVQANAICGQIRHDTGEEFKTYILSNDTGYHTCCGCHDSTLRALVCEHAIALAIYVFRAKYHAHTLSA
jgi:hypothetical protein